MMTKSEILELLKTTRTDTLKYFDLPENELSKTYGEGKWCIRQILHHLTDAECMLMARLKKIIARPKQVEYAFNPDEWNAAFDYLHAPLTGKKELYAASRAMTLDIIDRYYEDHCADEFVHSLTGLRTLQMEFEKVPMHNQSHNAQIRQALTR